MIPSLPARLLRTFVAPGELFEKLRERPLWAGVLVLGAVLVGLSVILVPVEVWQEMVREQIREQGQEMPPGFEGGGTLFRISSVVGGVAFWFIWAFLLAGLVTLFFSFLLGDEGGYKQYLAVVSHALLISAVGAVLVVPLKIAQGDPSLSLSLGTFAFFLEEGYPLRVLKNLDLFGLWGYGVMAVGVSKMDPDRSAGAAAAVLFAFALAGALVFGFFGG